MELNANFDLRAVIHAGTLAWVPSPTPGVERRMLDRIGDEVARATSIVRYAPNSRFPRHLHGGGEEFLVLRGVFEDEHGRYPAGSYIRNPPQSSHEPGSRPGCEIFVKLWQFDLADRTDVRVHGETLAYDSVQGRPGVEAAALHQDAFETVRLERWAPGTAMSYQPVGGLEVLVLDGSFEEAGDVFVEQSWLRLPPGDRLAATAGPSGTHVWLKEGHLVHDLVLPGQPA